jgi:hypothetical protein
MSAYMFGYSLFTIVSADLIESASEGKEGGMK